MKILYHHRVGSRDGQAVHLEELVAALRRQDAEVVVVGPESFAQASFGYDPKFIGWLKRLIPKTLYQFLELGYNVLAYRRLLEVANKFKPDVIYERYSLGLIAGIWLQRRLRIPLMLEVNAPLVAEKAEFGGIGWRGLANKVEKWIWRNADVTLPVTAVLAKYLSAAGVPDARIQVIGNAIDPRRFLCPSGLEASDDNLGTTISVGFVGFMRSWHGLDTVLDWLASAPKNVHLLVAGDGPAKPGLEAQANRLGLMDRVIFTGLVDRHSIAAVLAKLDIAIQPRCVPYASPLKLFEYMALGKAIIAPDQPNIREVLDNEVSALLFDPTSSQALAQSLDRLVQDKDLRISLGQGAQKAIVTGGLTWDHNAQRVLLLAKSLTATSS